MKYLFLFFALLFNLKIIGKIDLNIVGIILPTEGKGQEPVLFMEMLKNDLKLNYIKSRPDWLPDLKDVSKDIKNLVLNSSSKIDGKFSIFFDLPWDLFTGTHLSEIPKKGINFILSLIESTKLPKEWVSLINETFDAVIVPNQWLKKVHNKSGITIPIFILPHPVNIDALLKKDSKLNLYSHNDKSKKFTFGVSASVQPKKNLDTLIKAFQEEFSSSPNVELKIHASCAIDYHLEEIKKLINLKPEAAINFIYKPLSRNEYINFMSSLDCYVLISKGEGVSLSPREALALGIPCILSKNTAHKDICDTELVKSVLSSNPIPATYMIFGDQICGNQFECKIEDVKKALREVYTNYKIYLIKADKAKKWIEQYSIANCKKKYLNLIKPKKIILGTKNMVTDEYIITNSKGLYAKYLATKE